MFRQLDGYDSGARSQLASITQDVSAIVVLTQAAYDALTPDAATLYLITGE